MDPTTLMMLLGQSAQFGQMGRHPNQGQMPPMSAMPMGQQAQMPSMGTGMQMGQPQQPQGQLPSMAPPQGQPGDPSQQHHGHGGLNPLMLLSPLGGLLAGGGGMGALAPMFGLAGLFGSKLFK